MINLGAEIVTEAQKNTEALTTHMKAEVNTG